MKNQSKRVIPEFFKTRYSDFALLGSGGMGEVYRAYDTVLSKEVALKILPAQLLTPERVMRFQQEARAASKLNHPNLVQTLDFGIADSGEPYLILEYVTGESLDRILKDEQRLPVNAAVNIAIQVCLGMQHAHGNGVIHRDIKPSNIVVMDTELTTAQIKIIDFGIAKVVDETGKGLALTHSGNFIGTPYYMSPEQISGGAVDERSDVYSVGCILFRMLSGFHVFESDILLEVLQSTLNSKAPAIREVAANNDVPLELEMTVARALEKDPVKRQQSMDALKDEIIKVMEHNRVWTSASTTHGALPAANAPSASGASAPAPHLSAIAIALVSLLFVGAAIGLVNLFPKAEEPASPEQVERRNAKAEVSFEAALDKFKVENKGEEYKALQDIGITDSDLKALKKQRFTKLDLQNHREFTDAGLKYLEHKPLYRLNLLNCDIGDAGVKHLEKISTLRDLTLDMTNTSNKGLSDLKDLPLQFLSVAATKITDDGLKNLATMRDLKALNVSNNPITAKGMEAIKSLTLSELNVSETEIDNNALESIGGMRSLKRLFVAHNDVTLDGLKNLANLPKLEVISFDSCKNFDDECLAYVIKTWPELENIDISETDVSPAGLKLITKLPDLEKLRVGSLDLKDGDIEPILKLKKLKELELTYNPLLTNETLKKVSRMKTLQIIMAHGCNKLNADGAAYVEKYLPRARLFRNRTEEFDGARQEEVGNFVEILGRTRDSGNDRTRDSRQ